MEATRTGTLRVGVIGVGRIGRMHAELLARQNSKSSMTIRSSKPIPLALPGTKCPW